MATIDENDNPIHTGATEREPDDLRASLDAAFTEEPSGDEPPAPVEEGSEKPAGGPERDEHGRFKPKAKADGEQQPQEGEQQPETKPDEQQPQAAAPAPAEPALKAPASWTPEARELWKDVPPAAQAEIARREREHQQFMQETAQSRQFVQAFENVVRPFEMFIRAENSNPLQAVENLMVTAARLRTDPPQAKAQLVAGIINQFGVDLQMLDQILAGQEPQPGQQAQMQPQQFRDPRVDQLLAMQQMQAQQADQMETQQIAGAIEAFGADPKNEFFNDVRGIMADLIEVAARNGQVLDLTTAYSRACRLHDGVATILDKRAQSASGQAATQAALRAKRAAASVKADTTLPGAGGATVPQNDSVRSALEAAFGAVDND